MSLLFRRNLRSEKASDLLCHRTADLTRCSNTPPVRRSSRTSHVRPWLRRDSEGGPGRSRTRRPSLPARAGGAASRIAVYFRCHSREHRPLTGAPARHAAEKGRGARAAGSSSSESHLEQREPGSCLRRARAGTTGRRGKAARGKRARWSLRRVRHCA